MTETYANASVETEFISTNQRAKQGITITVWLIILFIATVLGLFYNKLTSPRVLSEAELKVNGAYQFQTPRALKDFQLTDHTAQPFQLKDLKDHWHLMYMGFTSCPHICPTTMATLSQAYKGFEPSIMKQTNVLLVSVDPERDTVEKLAEYVGNFNADFIGARGSQAETARLAQQLAAAYRRLPGDTQGNYDVDHTGYIFVINPNGHLHGFLKPPFDPGRMKLTFQSMVTAF